MDQHNIDQLIQADQHPPAAELVTARPSGPAALSAPDGPLTWFSHMVEHCLAHARAAKASGQPVVGIMCEYAPRELILAAGGVPVCLCGGAAHTIAAAEADLPANLCPLIKSTYGYHLEKSNPFLEMADLVVAETTCDGKKKMFELMGETRPALLLELPHKENDPDAFAHWLAELAKFRSALELRFGADLTDERLRAAINVMNRERALRRALAELMKADDPPFTGRQLLDFKSLISGMPEDFTQYEAAWRLGAPPDVARAVTEPSGSAAQASPERHMAANDSRPVRVLLTGVPLVHGAERVVDLIEGHGGLVVCMENCTGLKPILEDVDVADSDPLHALAKKYFSLSCSVKTRNEGRMASLRCLAAEYRVECVIELIWHACHTYAIEAVRVKRMVEHDLGLPYLRLETDYSPADSPRITVRVEALCETVRQRRPA